MAFYPRLASHSLGAAEGVGGRLRTFTGDIDFFSLRGPPAVLPANGITGSAKPDYMYIWICRCTYSSGVPVGPSVYFRIAQLQKCHARIRLVLI